MDIVELDRQLFSIIHFGFRAQWLDQVMILLSGPIPWIIAAGMAVYGLLKRKVAWQAFVFFLLSLGALDFLASQVIKPWVGRLRPCRVMTDLHIIKGCSGLYAFPSNHATNAMFLTLLFCLYLKKTWTHALVFVVTFLMGYSRMYLGVHYPGDILGGFFIGATTALVAQHIALRQSWIRLPHSD